jgi:hypothetical protein
MTKSLSPAAQAVMDQYVMGACGETYDISAGIAAALRAAAKQSIFADVAVNKTIEVVSVDILFAIAAELEGNV